MLELWDASVSSYACMPTVACARVYPMIPDAVTLENLVKKEQRDARSRARASFLSGDSTFNVYLLNLREMKH